MFSGVFVIFWSTFFSRFLLGAWSQSFCTNVSFKWCLYKNGGSGFWKKFRAENVCGAVLIGVHSPKRTACLGWQRSQAFHILYPMTEWGTSFLEILEKILHQGIATFAPYLVTMLILSGNYANLSPISCFDFAQEFSLHFRHTFCGNQWQFFHFFGNFWPEIGDFFHCIVPCDFFLMKINFEWFFGLFDDFSPSSAFWPLLSEFYCIIGAKGEIQKWGVTPLVGREKRE